MSDLSRIECKLDMLLERAIPKALLTTEEAAQYLRLSTDRLNQWRTQGVGPQFVRFQGRSIRYRLADIDAWLESEMQK